MQDAYVSLLALVVAAVLVIVVVGVGTTWVYVAETRRSDAQAPGSDENHAALPERHDRAA